MEHEYIEKKSEENLVDTGIRVKVQIQRNSNVLLKVGIIPPGFFEMAPCICLDADIEGNDELSRSNTKRQYPVLNQQKLAQMIILGIGGVRAFRNLNIPVRRWHLNEGSMVLAGTELVREKKAAGLSFAEALSRVKQEVVFTTHMPGMPGSETYELAEMKEMGCFPGLEESEVAFLGGIPSQPTQFHVTAASLRLAGKANAVSQLHAKTTAEIYAWVGDRCQIIPITNGADVSYWQWPEFGAARTPKAVKEAKAKYKTLFFEEIQRHYGQQGINKAFDMGTLTMGWGRRFDEYKRVWFATELNSAGAQRIQTAISGKPHLSDFPTIATWNSIWQKSKVSANLAILPENNYQFKKLMNGGVDLWLLSSRRPREACEECFIRAMFNGALVMASRDGGPLEISPGHCFLFGVEEAFLNAAEQDYRDLEEARQLLPKVIDLFYNKPEIWYQKALEAKEEAEEKFSAARMLKDYIAKLYF